MTKANLQQCSKMARSRVPLIKSKMCVRIIASGIVISALPMGKGREMYECNCKIEYNALYASQRVLRTIQ